MTNIKFKCRYCGGLTFDDDYGNCAACGAPRDPDDLDNYIGASIPVQTPQWMVCTSSASYISMDTDTPYPFLMVT
jgi:hypothetical protein